MKPGTTLRALGRDWSAVAGLAIILTLTVVAAFAPYLAPYPDDAYQIHLTQRLQPPSAAHWLGTDRLGADILSRILLGARATISVAVVAVAAALIIGVPVGLAAGYWSRAAPALMRTSDIFLAVPQLILAIAIAQTLGPAIQNVILALSVTYWPWFARIVYSQTLSAKREPYVEAAVAMGAAPLRVIVLHILPNIASPIIVRTSIGMGFTILTAAALGFLGLGAPPRTPEWGRMIAEARDYLPDAWWYALAPGMAIFIVVMGFSLFGDGLRDALDPKTARRGH